MYVLFDAFNKRTISRHRTVQAAATAKMKFDKQFRKNNGQGSYLPVSLMVEGNEELKKVGDYEQYKFDSYLSR